MPLARCLTATAGALHDAAGEGDVAKIRTLLSKGARVNAQAEYGYTSLHAAAQLGQVEAVDALLKAGADIDARARYEVTPLHSAAFWGQVETVRVLLEAGALVNAKSSVGCSPIDYARISMDDTEGSVAPFEETIKVLRAAGGRAAC